MITQVFVNNHGEKTHARAAAEVMIAGWAYSP